MTLCMGMPPSCERSPPNLPCTFRQGREAVRYRRPIGGMVGVVVRVRTVRRAPRVRGGCPVGSTVVREALKETRDAYATYPYAVQTSPTLFPSRLFARCVIVTGEGLVRRQRAPDPAARQSGLRITQGEGRERGLALPKSTRRLPLAERSEGSTGPDRSLEIRGSSPLGIAS